MSTPLVTSTRSSSDRPASQTDPSHEAIPDTPLLGGVRFDTPLRRQALVWSLWDGILGAAMIALVETFAVAAAVKLKAPAMAIAMLGSLPLLVGSLLQLVSPLLVSERRTRKGFVIWAVVIQALFVVAAGLSGYLPASMAVATYLIAFTLYGSSGNAVSNLWMSWMADLVPQSVRGRLFAWRGRIFAGVSLGCSLTVGLLARRYTSETAPWVFFTIVFSVAGLVRLGCAFCLTRQHEPPPAVERGRRAWPRVSREFVIFAAASALLNGSAAMAGPFFGVWFLRDLHFDYLALAICSSATILGSMTALPLWGRLADTSGNRRVMQVTAFLVALVPLPYLALDSRYMIWLFNFYSGVAWAGYNISSFNFMLAAAGPDRPERAISYAAAATGVAVFVFGLLGGWLAPRLPVFFTWQLRSVFAFSGLLRLLVVLAIFRMLGRIELALPPHMLDLFNELPGYRIGMGVLRSTFRAFRRQ
jgi:MFS family permease